MKHSQLCDRIFVAVSLSALVAATMRADDLYIWAQETMSGVTFFYSGSVDTSSFPVAGAGKGKGKGTIEPSSGFVRFSGSDFDTYSVLPASGRTYGPGGTIIASDSTGDVFGLDGESGTDMYLATDYTSGQTISGSMEFPGETFSSLEVDTTPFTFDTTVGDNTIHMFTMPPATTIDNSVLKMSLQSKIKKLQKKAKKLSKKGKKAKAKKLKKKAKKLKQQLAAL
jgi:hypothetical protein